MTFKGVFNRKTKTLTMPKDLIGKAFVKWTYDGHVQQLIYVYATSTAWGENDEKCLCYSYDADKKILYTQDMWNVNMLITTDVYELKKDLYKHFFEHFFDTEKVITKLN